AAVSFILDKTAPATATVTTPAAGSSFAAAAVPASFSGSVADNTGGAGLAANSTTFTLKRSSDNNYWNGSGWQTAVFNLAAGNTVGPAAVPASFSGSVADNTGGVGLAANSTTFTLQRGSDGWYWTGSAWQSAVFNLAASNGATSGSTAATWTNSATLPTWS